MDPLSDRAGEVIAGRYRLDRAIGRGGMGAVYAATHLELGRHVAVKLLLPHFAAEPELLERFRREALAAASLHHPNIVQVTDFGHAPDGAPFLAMELLEGAPLTRRLAAEGAQPWPRVAPLLAQLLGALSAAHAAGIVHRDIKPDNVFLVALPGDGALVKLLDFGIAKLTDGATYRRLTETGMVLGTPTYLAPEQMLGERVDARSDVYAVGVLAYCALAGRVPFRGDNPALLLRAVLEGGAEPLARVRPDLPAPVTALVERAMARMPHARFQSADDMLAALTALDAQPAAHATPPPARAAPRWTAPPPMPSTVMYRAPTAPVVSAPARAPRSWLGIAVALVLGAVLGAAGDHVLGTRPHPSAAGSLAVLAGPSPSVARDPDAPPGSDTLRPGTFAGLGYFRAGPYVINTLGVTVSIGYPDSAGLTAPLRAWMQQAAACIARLTFTPGGTTDATIVDVTLDSRGAAMAPYTVSPAHLPDDVARCLRVGLDAIRVPRPSACYSGNTQVPGYCSTVGVMLTIARN